MSNVEAFDYLVIGLVKLLQQNSWYPYPDFLQRTCNILALMMVNIPYPRTLAGFLKLIEEPVKDWYPLEVPNSFDLDFGLFYDGRLSEEAARYFYDELLERTQLPESASTITQQLAIENYQFQKLIDRLREQSNTEFAQREYVLLRSFLIENPYTTTTHLRQEFGTGITQLINPQEVGNLYDDCDETLTHWNCERCGPLTEKQGRLHGNKPSVCNDHRKSFNYVRKIKWERELRRVKPGIHTRVCLPGIYELQLFQKMLAFQNENPKQLDKVLLYPELDRYDLQLQFADGIVWAIDVKDYRSPYQLAGKLLPIYCEGTLKYDEGFYVFPNYRILNRENYIQITREEAKKLPAKIHLLSDIEFEQCVISKISELKKGEKSNVAGKSICST
jgi:hypothetical protein